MIIDMHKPPLVGDIASIPPPVMPHSTLVQPPLPVPGNNGD